MSALAHQKYTLSDASFRVMKHNTVPWNLFFNKRSGAVVMSPDSEGLGAAVVARVGSNLTQPSGISYFSFYLYIYNQNLLTCNSQSLTTSFIHLDFLKLCTITYTY